LGRLQELEEVELVEYCNGTRDQMLEDMKEYSRYTRTLIESLLQLPQLKKLAIPNMNAFPKDIDVFQEGYCAFGIPMGNSTENFGGDGNRTIINVGYRYSRKIRILNATPRKLVCVLKYLFGVPKLSVCYTYHEKTQDVKKDFTIIVSHCDTKDLKVYVQNSEQIDISDIVIEHLPKTTSKIIYAKKDIHIVPHEPICYFSSLIVRKLLYQFEKPEHIEYPEDFVTQDEELIQEMKEILDNHNKKVEDFEKS
jgi:hypothetical protein